MYNRVVISILLIILSFYSLDAKAQDFYKIPHIEIQDERIVKAIADYIREEEWFDIPGLVVLVFDKNESNTFYFTYTAYENVIKEFSPSYYLTLNRKMVLIYTGFEEYLNFGKSSYKGITKAAKNIFFPDNSILIEPINWKVTLTDAGYKKELVDNLPYGWFSFKNVNSQ